MAWPDESVWINYSFICRRRVRRRIDLERGLDAWTSMWRINDVLTGAVKVVYIQRACRGNGRGR